MWKYSALHSATEGTECRLLQEASHHFVGFLGSSLNQTVQNWWCFLPSSCMLPCSSGPGPCYFAWKGMLGWLCQLAALAIGIKPGITAALFSLFFLLSTEPSSCIGLKGFVSEARVLGEESWYHLPDVIWKLPLQLCSQLLAVVLFLSYDSLTTVTHVPSDNRSSIIVIPPLQGLK